MGGARRLEDDVPDPGLVQRLVHLFDGGGEALFGRPRAQPEQANLAVEGPDVGKHPIVSRLQVKAGERRSAERADVGKAVQVTGEAA